MRIRILGSSAGGGFPQWNCNCSNCQGLRTERVRSQPRTQSSVAVSEASSNRYVLLNASPDIGSQLRNWSGAQPARTVRDTAIVAIVLVDSQIDHCAGLLSLRENAKLQIHCTDAVFADLTTRLPILPLLESYAIIRRHRIPNEESAVWGIEGIESLSFKGIPVVGKAPPYSLHRENGVIGDNIAIEITDAKSNKTLLYAPGIEIFDSGIEQAITRADCILIDGTFWTNDEMNLHGISQKTAKEMGHLCLSGSGGLVEHLSQFPSKRRILIHVNNTNPILDEDSEERKMLDRIGIEVAFDGMEFDL